MRLKKIKQMELFFSFSFSFWFRFGFVWSCVFVFFFLFLFLFSSFFHSNQINQINQIDFDGRKYLTVSGKVRRYLHDMGDPADVTDFAKWTKSFGSHDLMALWLRNRDGRTRTNLGITSFTCMRHKR